MKILQWLLCCFVCMSVLNCPSPICKQVSQQSTSVWEMVLAKNNVHQTEFMKYLWNFYSASCAVLCVYVSAQWTAECEWMFEDMPMSWNKNVSQAHGRGINRSRGKSETWSILSLSSTSGTFFCVCSLWVMSFRYIHSYFESFLL